MGQAYKLGRWLCFLTLINFSGMPASATYTFTKIEFSHNVSACFLRFRFCDNSANTIYERFSCFDLSCCSPSDSLPRDFLKLLSLLTFISQLSSVFFWMYRSLYTGPMPTQMPPHAYAEWKGCLRGSFP